MFFCSFYNLIGCVWMKEEFLQFGLLCIKYNVIVVVDEIYFDIIYVDYIYILFVFLFEELVVCMIICMVLSKIFNIVGL